MAKEEALTPEERVAKYWATDRKGDRYISWLEHPVILRNVNRRVTGDPAISPLIWFQRTYLKQMPDLALSLGCGLGAFERDGINIKIANRFHAHDISPGAIETARKEAAKAGVGDRIAYSVLDFNNAELPVATYDVVFGLSAIHHVFQLEDLFKKVRRSLKPGALFYLDEYVGPTRFATDPNVVEIINSIRRFLPERLRLNLFAKDGQLMGRYKPSPVEHFEAHDPSEAVRSAEILPILKLFFDVLEFRSYGGAIQHMLLSGMTGNFDEANPDDVALLEMIMLMEEKLEQAGAITADFGVIVCKARP